MKLIDLLLNFIGKNIEKVYTSRMKNPNNHQFGWKYFETEGFSHDDLKYLNLWKDLIGSISILLSKKQLKSFNIHDSTEQSLLDDIDRWNSSNTPSDVDIKEICINFRDSENAFAIKETEEVIRMKVDPIKAYVLDELKKIMA